MFIKTEVLDQLGLSVTNAAQVLAVRRATLSDLVTKKAFQLNMDMLLRMQARYDATEMRKQAGRIAQTKRKKEHERYETEKG